MHLFRLLLFTFSVAASFAGCDLASSPKIEILDPVEGPSQLLVEGKPMHLRGAQTDSHLALLKKAGANALLIPSDRPWRDTALTSLLNQAATLELHVVMPVPVDLEALASQDQAQVKRAIQQSAKAVQKLSSHSNIILWVVTPKHLTAIPPALPEHLEPLLEAIRSADPHRPVAFDLAPLNVESLTDFVPALQSFDALGIEIAGNQAGGKRLRDAGWRKAYFLTAYGMPPWQHHLDEDGLLREPSSQQQAQLLADIHAREFTDDSDCIGGFVRGWSEEPKGTLTYGALFLQRNRTLAAFDVVQQEWTQNAIINPAPTIGELRLVDANDRLTAGSSIAAEIGGVPTDQSLRYHWILTTEPNPERPQESIEVISQMRGRSPRQVFGLPYASGKYRLHVVVEDARNRAATASKPLTISG